MRQRLHVLISVVATSLAIALPNCTQSEKLVLQGEKEITAELEYVQVKITETRCFKLNFQASKYFKYAHFQNYI